MTLERHRSSLIPDVDFAGDGRIFVTDRQGSYPLRSKHYDKPSSKDINWGKDPKDKKYEKDKKERNRVSRTESWDRPWEYDRGRKYLDVADVGSYHSYDPKREQRKYKPKQMTNYEVAMREITGTVSSKSSNSLSRKLRRSKSSKYYMDDGRYGSFRSGGASSYASTGRRFKRGGTPKMPSGMTEDFQRGNSKYRSLDVNALRRVQKEMNNNEMDPYTSKMNGYSGSLFNGYIPRVKKINEETLPFVIFLAIGIMLVLVGATKLLFSYWHEYLCLLWTGIVVLCLGMVGACHRAQYLDTAKSLSYILLAVLSAVCTMVCVAFILPVLVPILRLIVADTNVTEISTLVTVTNWNKTLVPVSSMSTEVMVYLSICLDVAGLLLVCAGFASLTVMLIALNYYWDASFDTTGECDHRGKPRFFNPLEQMSLAQASILLGLLTINLQLPDVNTYFSPIWGPFLLLIAGFSALCFGKRPDLDGLGFLSTFIEVTGMLASGVATVLVTLGLVESISTLMSAELSKGYQQSDLIASAIAAAIFIVIMIVNIVFAVGIIFRHIRHMCCAECFDEYLDEPYKKHPGSDHYDVRL